MVVPALMELMAPELQEAERKAKMKGREEGRQEGRQEGREEGIRGTVDILQSFGLSNAEIKEAIMKRYSLTEKETEKFLWTGLSITK